MDKELERRFLGTIGRYLVSLPFDLKVLLEAAADSDLERAAREVAAGTVVYVLASTDKTGDREHRIHVFVHDAILVRAALKRVAELGGEGAAALVARFPDEYSTVDDDVALFSQVLGELYPWLAGKLDGFKKLHYKGRRAFDYLDDDDGATFLYDEWLAFQTDYDLTEQALEGRLRKLEPILETLRRKRADEARKIS
jgi:hypothetical protein